MPTITLNVRFFGSLRKFGNGIDLFLSQGSSISAFKDALCAALKNQDGGLIQDCALADDSRVLAQDHVFMQNGQVCILPPVCGG